MGINPSALECVACCGAALSLLKMSASGGIAKLSSRFLLLSSKCLQVDNDSETVMVLMTVSRFVTLESEIGIRTEE